MSGKRSVVGVHSERTRPLQVVVYSDVHFALFIYCRWSFLKSSVAGGSYLRPSIIIVRVAFQYMSNIYLKCSSSSLYRLLEMIFSWILPAFSPLNFIGDFLPGGGKCVPVTACQGPTNWGMGAEAHASFIMAVHPGHHHKVTLLLNVHFLI